MLKSAGNLKKYIPLVFAIGLLAAFSPLLVKQFSAFGTLKNAIASGSLGRVERLLNAHPKWVNTKDKLTGMTPLHWAVTVNKLKIVKCLLARGASVNARDKFGETSLHKAITPNHTQILKVLLKHDARLDVLVMKHRTFRMAPLHLAAKDNFTNAAGLLLDHGADVNVRTQGTNSLTPLHWAAAWGQRDMVNLLLARGADINARDVEGKTPLRFALKLNRPAIADLLRQHGGTQ